MIIYKNISRKILKYATIILLFSLSFNCQAREFFWQDIKVKAFLNKKGELEIKEELVAFFKGNFDSVTRFFHLPGNKDIRLKKFEVYNPSNDSWTLLTYGDLSKVNQYMIWNKGQYI
mgnify:CR=1 FL=1|tara:strand:+ start:1240 stop:1590 length:351 start_codon:yes stop_codon:yes gene_type:complete